MATPDRRGATRSCSGSVSLAATQFSRELQKNRGRYYLMAPLAMVNVLLASMLVLTGYAPFTGISVLFWIGLACNQALTFNGLASYVRRAGAWSGLAIWLSQRFRDLMLLPPLAFTEMTGVLTALSKGIRIGFVFRTSGRSEVGQDSPIAKSLTADSATYLSVLVMVVTGSLGTVLNLFAMSQLDLGNVVMLYPSLVFIEGLALGGFIYWGRRGPGRSMLGVARWSPKVLGFVVGLVAVTSFSLGVGVAREVEWRDLLGDHAIAGWLAPLPPHVAVLSQPRLSSGCCRRDRPSLVRPMRRPMRVCGFIPGEQSHSGMILG